MLIISVNEKSITNSRRNNYRSCHEQKDNFKYHFYLLINAYGNKVILLSYFFVK